MHAEDFDASLCWCSVLNLPSWISAWPGIFPDSVLLQAASLYTDVSKWQKERQKLDGEALAHPPFKFWYCLGGKTERVHVSERFEGREEMGEGVMRSWEMLAPGR